MELFPATNNQLTDHFAHAKDYLAHIDKTNN